MSWGKFIGTAGLFGAYNKSDGTTYIRSKEDGIKKNNIDE